MPSDDYVKALQERLLEVRLFIRYFDMSDLEFLGVKSSLE
jgi:hypothetical protein